ATSIAFKTFIDNVVAAKASSGSTGGTTGGSTGGATGGTSGSGGTAGSTGGSTGSTGSSGGSVSSGNVLLDEFVTYIAPVMESNGCQACHRSGGTGSGFALQAGTSSTVRQANFTAVQTYLQNSVAPMNFHDKPARPGVAHIGPKVFDDGDATSIAFKAFITHVRAASSSNAGLPPFTPTGNATFDFYVQHIEPVLVSGGCQSCHRSGGVGDGFRLVAWNTTNARTTNYNVIVNFIRNEDRTALHDKAAVGGDSHPGTKPFTVGDATSQAFMQFINMVRPN
ncbi:MAG TPA: hypothetical protein VFM46_04840, partial [Pseudomonadales bacterium]|nr:hypothetical protein [Pseudomonadales bacterium]